MSSAVVASLLANQAPTGAEVISRLREHQGELRTKYGVESIALFGRVAEGTATPNSVVELLVEFRTPPTFRKFFETQYFLEEILGREVDLVTRDGMPERRLQVALQGELIHA